MTFCRRHHDARCLLLDNTFTDLRGWEQADIKRQRAQSTQAYASALHQQSGSKIQLVNHKLHKFYNESRFFGSNLQTLKAFLKRAHFSLWFCRVRSHAPIITFLLTAISDCNKSRQDFKPWSWSQKFEQTRFFAVWSVAVSIVSSSDLVLI